jgi:hypothetical protein
VRVRTAGIDVAFRIFVIKVNLKHGEVDETTMKTGSFWLERAGRQKATTSSTKVMNQGTQKLNSSCGQQRIRFRASYHGTRTSDPNGRCVRRNGRTFLEGHLDSMVTELRDDAQEALGQGRPSGTARRRKN